MQRLTRSRRRVVLAAFGAAGLAGCSLFAGAPLQIDSFDIRYANRSEATATLHRIAGEKPPQRYVLIGPEVLTLGPGKQLSFRGGRPEWLALPRVLSVEWSNAARERFRVAAIPIEELISAEDYAWAQREPERAHRLSVWITLLPRNRVELSWWRIGPDGITPEIERGRAVFDGLPVEPRR